MWKPALFLVTIVLVTPDGRSAVEDYFGRASSVLATGSPYFDLALIALALVALLSLLLMFCQSPRKPETEWVWRVVREDVAVIPYSGRTR